MSQLQNIQHICPKEFLAFLFTVTRPEPHKLILANVAKLYHSNKRAISAPSSTPSTVCVIVSAHHHQKDPTKIFYNKTFE
ncbi:uncharacterized protein PHALS_14796 [Plasmopara halstedii]|uniref:Uncharacterized protein n=1 Tax=Plasmopara halstedii TaxID=4781 RepID=A0A0P1AW58_PLAHL|nr:uncharacterized protein PHALS_14796 [Plasmopara halstedii]CEG45241.1 hypothetical protein PHALS_14796 [Plasmopara halstedii]|eukprot:XP_024581610.1 hypothetical protein PHALS_14796 [Plasmopara halstedii]